MRHLDEESTRYVAARKDGNFDIAAVIAGESAGLNREISSTREVVDRIVRDASTLLARGNSYVEGVEA
jgi:nitronate monooxygenase